MIFSKDLFDKANHKKKHCDFTDIEELLAKNLHEENEITEICIFKKIHMIKIKIKFKQCYDDH